MTSRYAQKKVVVVGAGKSGRALCRFFASRAAHVVLSDRRTRDRLEEIDSLAGLPITYDLGGHDVERFRAADLVVLSPGVPDTIDAVAAARQSGVAVIGEIEVAARELDAPMVGITGTNGKSTVTALAGEAFRAGGKKTFVGGNIGDPLTDAVFGDGWEWVIVELSSFQLETIEAFRPRYSMLLNVSADHLDRYPDMGSYVAAKRNIFRNQTADDFMILNGDDAAVLEAAVVGRATPILFSTRTELPEGAFLRDGTIVWRWRGEEKCFPVAELKIRGLHNVANVMAAMVPALVEELPAAQVWSAMCDFRGLPHRMNLVRVLDDVAWYNDSKGTNIGSVIMSLAGLDAPVTLIAGGKDKGGDFGELSAPVRAKVRHLILLGEAAGRMAEEIGPVTDITRVGSLEEAVRTARDVTPPGGTVLLSPGCSSFDMFSNFAERGDIFTRLVRGLEAKRAIGNGNS